MFGSRVGFSGTALFTVRTNPRWRPPRHLEKISSGDIYATGRPIHFMFCSRAGLSGTADLMALFPVRTNPRWRPPPCWKNFKWLRYLRNRLSDPLHVLFYGGVFGDGGSNGAISGSNKSKMAAAAILEKFQMAITPQPVVYLRNGSRIARSSSR